MSVRRAYLDASPGERRGVVALDGRPERLLIERVGDLAAQALGARAIGRVRAVNRAQNLAFVDIGEGPPGVLDIDPGGPRLGEGMAVEVEIRAQARRGKGATLRLLGTAEGEPRLLAPGPSLEERLRAHVGAAPILEGGVARAMADAAEEAALAIVHPVGGGASIAVESTRALVAVDVDLGSGGGGEAKRAARTANFAAVREAARVLRLKGLGGLVAIDLVGRGHDAPAMLAAARAAFAPDNPGVAFAPVSRFGVLELTIPRRARASLEILTDEAGAVGALTHALALARAAEREADADRGARLRLLAGPEVAHAAGPALDLLRAKIGDRFTLTIEEARAPHAFAVARA